VFLTKKHLSRRALLKGLGISLGLPLLDAMIPPATALSQTAAARKIRAGFFYLPHGAIMNNTPLGAAMDRWMPSGSGADFKLNTITKSLEPYKKYVTSFGNIKNDATNDVPNAAQTHAFYPATWLSATKPEVPGPRMSETLDQVIADNIGQKTSLRSLEVASEANPSGMNVPPYTVLSFRDATTPLQMEFNPRKVFLKLFGDGQGRPLNPEGEIENASLLDLITDQTRALQRDLNTSDRAILDSHLTAVREAEQRVEQRAARAQELNATQLPPIPGGVLDAFEEQVKLLFDLIAIAYRMDQTRVVSFLMAAERTNRTYDHIGVRDSFHPLSHHANDPQRIEGLVKIQTWHMECFAEFLGKLAAVQDGEATLLDNALFLYGSNLSNSNMHTTSPLPTLLIGGADGKLAGGRHLEQPNPTPIANLHLALLGMLGIERKTFGDSTGTIAL
jgi:hypothetical protein